jgi:hypothetical protein
MMFDSHIVRKMQNHFSQPPQMPELNSHKRTLRSSRSTDAKTSETSVVDDATQPPPNSSPGEQQQQQRVYKKANKRVNKKAKRES